MKNRKLIVLMVLMLLILTTVSNGSGLVKKINASQAGDMSFAIDGDKWQPLETDGQPLYPIIVNGRSYVPVRALLERFGIGVDYDAALRLIKLTSKEIDKASPKLAAFDLGTKPGEANIISFESESLVGLGGPKLTQSTTLEVAEAVEIWLDGKKIEGTMETLSAMTLSNLHHAKFSVDPTSGLVTKIDLKEEVHSDGDMGSAQRLVITITVTTKPLTVTITIKYQEPTRGSFFNESQY